MGRSPRTTGLAVLAALLAAGCSSSPWSAHRLAADPATDAAAGASISASQPEAIGYATATGTNDQALMEVMDELTQLGALDPAAQAKLMEDLSQTDPAWWPMVVQQFRAAVAYRRQAEQRPQGADSPADDGSVQFVSGVFYPGETAQRHTSSAAGQAYPAPQPSGGGAAPQQIARLPTAKDAAVTPSRAPQAVYPATGQPGAFAHLADRAVGNPPPAEPGDWRAELAEVIRTLQSRLQTDPTTDEQVADHARLRMLHLLAGHREDAVQPIPSVSPAEQQFWSKQLYALATWLDTERAPDRMDRAAETKQVLEEAIARLGEAAPLLVRNLAFCTEVQSYGCQRPFETNEFAPGQEVLLYAEVENLTGEPTPEGFHTSLRSSYQVFDSRGQRVAEHEFSSTEEYCQNPRRDFFIGYHLYLPNRIYAGEHTLQLTIEDLKSHKVGQSSIELTITDVER